MSVSTPKFRLGMVGGGPGAFIGAVHRTALALDGRARLVAGVFSSDSVKSSQQAHELNIDTNRVYNTYQEMATREASLPVSDRIDAVVIVTPNNLHEPIATAFLKAKIPVICDKPMAATRDQAERMHALATQTGVPLIITYNYTGYPLVRHARELVRSGQLGDLRKVVVHYHQGWLASPIEQQGQKQAAWRTDPTLAGAGALGDIGSHAENLVHFITGLTIEKLSADVASAVPGRKVDDDVSVYVRFKPGTNPASPPRGIFSISQICIGRENDLSIEIFGSKGSLAWRQESPNGLTLCLANEAPRTLTRGSVTSTSATEATRLPPGHPEGFYEAFANIYRGAFDAILAWRERKPPTPLAVLTPTSADGLRGLRFIDACQRSGREDGNWITLD